MKVKKILKNFLNIETTSAHKVITLFGFKIKLKKYSQKEARIAEIVAREAYSALEVSRLHGQVFSQFKNCNKGKTLTIIGCGSSIKYYNAEADYINIALNKALLLENINFTYSFAFDSKLLASCPEYMDLIKKRDCIKFIGKFLCPDFEYNFPEFQDGEKYKIYRYFGAKRHAMPNLKKFEYELHCDISTYPLADFYSVSFAALHFALYTYPVKIYLVGLDSAPSPNYFDGNTSYNYKKMVFGYKKFKEFAKQHYPKTRIISVNPLGLRGIFEDVYTESFAAEHKELKNVQIIKENTCNNR